MTEGCKGHPFASQNQIETQVHITACDDSHQTVVLYFSVFMCLELDIILARCRRVTQKTEN